MVPILQQMRKSKPLKWWQGVIVLGIPAVLGFVGGILAGVGMGKKD